MSGVAQEMAATVQKQPQLQDFSNLTLPSNPLQYGGQGQTRNQSYLQNSFAPMQMYQQIKQPQFRSSYGNQPQSNFGSPMQNNFSGPLQQRFQYQNGAK